MYNPSVSAHRLQYSFKSPVTRFDEDAVTARRESRSGVVYIVALRRSLVGNEEGGGERGMDSSGELLKIDVYSATTRRDESSTEQRKMGADRLLWVGELLRTQIRRVI